MGQIQLMAMSTAKTEVNQMASAPGQPAASVRSSPMPRATSPVSAQPAMTSRDILGSFTTIPSS